MWRDFQIHMNKNSVFYDHLFYFFKDPVKKGLDRPLFVRCCGIAEKKTIESGRNEYRWCVRLESANIRYASKNL